MIWDEVGSLTRRLVGWFIHTRRLKWGRNVLGLGLGLGLMMLGLGLGLGGIWWDLIGGVGRGLEGLMDVWMGGRMDGWMDEWKGRYLITSCMILFVYVVYISI